MSSLFLHPSELGIMMPLRNSMSEQANRTCMPSEKLSKLNY